MNAQADSRFIRQMATYARHPDDSVMRYPRRVYSAAKPIDGGATYAPSLIDYYEANSFVKRVIIINMIIINIKIVGEHPGINCIGKRLYSFSIKFRRVSPLLFSRAGGLLTPRQRRRRRRRPPGLGKAM